MNCVRKESYNDISVAIDKLKNWVYRYQRIFTEQATVCIMTDAQVLYFDNTAILFKIYYFKFIVLFHSFLEEMTNLWRKQTS